MNRRFWHSGRMKFIVGMLAGSMALGVVPSGLATAPLPENGDNQEANTAWLYANLREFATAVYGTPANDPDPTLLYGVDTIPEARGDLCHVEKSANERAVLIAGNVNRLSLDGGSVTVVYGVIEGAGGRTGTVLVMTSDDALLNTSGASAFVVNTMPVADCNRFASIMNFPATADLQVWDVDRGQFIGFGEKKKLEAMSQFSVDYEHGWLSGSRLQREDGTSVDFDCVDRLMRAYELNREAARLNHNDCVANVAVSFSLVIAGCFAAAAIPGAGIAAVGLCIGGAYAGMLVGFAFCERAYQRELDRLAAQLAIDMEGCYQ